MEKSQKNKKEDGKKNILENKFLEGIEKKARKTISKYKMISPDSRILVAASGGKDSTVCLHILKKLGYSAEAVTIDASIGEYTKENLDNIKSFCKDNGIKLHELSFRKEYGKSLCYIKSMLDSKGIIHSSCMLCGILKRHLLNKFARENGFDLLATGHNLDDEAEAFLMNLFRSDYSKAITQGPKSADNVKGFVPRIKPLYFISNNETKRYCEIMGFKIHFGACPCSSNAHRRKFRNILNELEASNPSIKNCAVTFLEKMKMNAKALPKKEGNYCESCGELCSKNLCKKCEIFNKI